MRRFFALALAAAVASCTTPGASPVRATPAAEPAQARGPCPLPDPDEERAPASPAQARAYVASIDRNVIRRVVQAHLHEIRACYEEGLSYDDSLRGRVTLRWAIVEGGFADDVVATENELADDCVAACMIDALGTWRFPEFPGRVVVNYPFTFEPAEATPATP